ncbi:MAG: S8 family peptidase [Chitinophagales bacterium]|nr:S8 family peptidase [Chitinophagales bacterium]
MKYLVCICVGVWWSLQIQAQPGLSAGTKLLLHKLKKEEGKVFFDGFVYKQDNRGSVYVSGLVEVENNFNPASFESIGVRVGTKTGNIYTVRVPVERFEKFTQTAGVKFIDVDQPMLMQLDSVRKATKVDSVHGGYDLPMPYTGKNVVVGVIDAGFDYSHPVFYDTAYSNYRVKKVWEQKSSGVPPAGFSYGNELADSAAILAKGFDVSDGSHGTHVAGIAGGSGFGGDATNKEFRGIAYNSDLVFVAIYPTPQYWLSTGMSDMLDGINYTFNYAASVGKPAVANLSWGCPLGPHDGNSLFSKACDNLVGAGKIFVLSGGNNNNNIIHLGKTFELLDTAVSTIVTFPSSLTEKKNQVDIWGDSSHTFCIRFGLWNGSTKYDSTALVCLDDNVHSFSLIGSDGDTCFVTVSTTQKEFNQKPHALVQLFSKTTNKLALTVEGYDGSINMWQGIVVKTSGHYGSFAKSGYGWAVNGDAEMVVSDMVSTRRAIAVAAYNTKNSFTNVNGNKQTYSGYTRGNIAAFSSKGPTADGRTKPDIAAPGMIVSSAVSSVDSEFMATGASYTSVTSVYTSAMNGVKYPFAALGGTSMAGPAVSGIVALMLEINPNLTPESVMQILAETAIADNFTGTIPSAGSNTWGFGKVNAYGAIKKTLITVGIVHEPSVLQCMLYPNPSTSGSYKIQLESINGGKAEVTVYNSNMQQVHASVFEMVAGSNTLPLQMHNASNGLYVVKVKAAGQESVIKLAKQ